MRIGLKLLCSMGLVLLAGCGGTGPGEEAETLGQARQDLQGAPAPAQLRLGYFSKSVVITVAQKKGYFADEALQVSEFLTPSSPAIFRALRDGQRDIILTQIDNVFNYRFNPSNPLGGTFDARAFMGTDWGNGASLLARPQYTTVESLRGKTVAVDSPNSGFAFVLYGIMRKHGLEPGRDYTVITTGGTPFRYADLVAGKFDATILNAGYQFRAEDAGMSRLGDLPDAMSPFMGGSAVAMGPWLDANRDVAIRFIRAYQRAQEYVLDPANREEILGLLQLDMGTRRLAEKSYAVLVKTGEGLIPDSSIDRQGLYGTASLRDQFGGFDTPQNLEWLTTPASGVFDLGPWLKASAPRGEALGHP